MNVRAKIDKRDLMELDRLFKDIGVYTNKSVDELVRQTMRFALISAKNATRPRSKSVDKNGNRRGGNKLAKKYLYRPLVTMPASMGFWYAKKGTKKPFQLNKNLSRSELTRQGLVRVTKGIKKRVKNKWTYIPWIGKADKQDARFKIPFAGLAREGWLRAMGAFNSKDAGQGYDYNPSTRGIHYAQSSDKMALSINRVKYVTKSSPGSARYGLNRAVNRMRGTYIPKIDRAVSMRWRSAGKSATRVLSAL